MDRRKAEAQGQLETLKQECEITTELLKKLTEMCSNHVNDLINLDSKSFRKHSKYFLNLLQFQSLSIQKIMEWNIDLEEFLTEKGPAHLPHDTVINSVHKNSCSSEYESISSVDSPCASDPSETESLIALSKTDIEIKTNPEINDKSNLVKNCTLDDEDTKIGSESSEYESHLPIACSVPYVSETDSMLGLNKHREITDRDDKVQVINENLDASSSVDETIIVQNDYQIAYNSHNESISSSDYFCSMSSVNADKNSVKTDISSYTEFYSDFEENVNTKHSEMVSQDIPSNNVVIINENRMEKTKKNPPISISEQLKTLPIISLQDRFLKSLPKAQMPDVSLRPVSEIEASSKSDNPVNNKLTLENIQKVYGPDNATKSLVNKKINKKHFEEYKNPETLELPERKPPKVGDIFMIGYVQTPSEIYIQVADENSNSLDVLSMQLSELYENSPVLHTTKAAAMRKFGNFWIFNDNNTTYRVEIVDWVLNEKSDDVLVQLIDYGWQYWVQFSSLRPLALDINLRNIPRMAQLCHLGYLYPPGSTKHRRQKEWPKEVNDNFYEILGDLNYTSFKIVHVYYCNERKSYEIEFIKTDEKHEENTIGQILIYYGLAVEIIDDCSELMGSEMTEQIRTAHGLNGISSDMPINDILEKYFQENEEEEPGTIDEAVMHYNSRDEAETCKNLRPDGTCYKGKSCKFRHQVLTSGFTNDKEPVYDQAINIEPLPSPNDEVSVVISHINNIRCFYAQIRKENNNGYRATLANLINTMNNPNIIKTYKKLQLPPCPSEMVIAKHWNNYWYRAQVLNVHIPEDSNNVIVEVFIVDFGDTLDIPMSDLRIITPDLLVLSFQAIECRLYNVKHKQGVNPEEEKKHFELEYLGQTFKAKIMAVPGHLEVILENDDGDDIGLKLIEDGFGELNTDHVFPADNERVLID